MIRSNGDLPDDDSAEPGRGHDESVLKEKSSRRSFSKLRRELSDEESLSPGVQRMLFDEIERLESECAVREEFRERFHQSDKRVGILEEKNKTKMSIEIVHVACITAGAAALGYAPSVWSQPHGWMMVAFGVILIVGGLIAKAIRL